MTHIHIEDDEVLEEDHLEEDEELEELEEDDSPEFGERMGWPSAVAYIAMFLAVALMWHDCFGRH